MKRWLIYHGLLSFLLADRTILQSCATHSVTPGLQLDLQYPPSHHK